MIESRTQIIRCKHQTVVLAYQMLFRGPVVLTMYVTARWVLQKRPPAEIGTLSVTGVGAIVAGVGTGVSLVGNGVNFFATHDFVAAGIDGATNLASLLGGRAMVSGSIVRGVLATEIGNDANTRPF